MANTQMTTRESVKMRLRNLGGSVGMGVAELARSALEEIEALEVEVASRARVERVQEAGPWKVVEHSGPYDWAIASDDFHHDVVLVVTGDFDGNAGKRSYAEEIARRLNAASASNVLCPACLGVGSVQDGRNYLRCSLCNASGELPERATENAGSTPARWPRFGKEGGFDSRAVSDGSEGLAAGKDRQSFWLIETPDGRGFYSAYAPEWPLDTARQWTYDALEAIRYCSEEQAERAAKVLDLPPYAVREHLWTTPDTEPVVPMQGDDIVKVIREAFVDVPGSSIAQRAADEIERLRKRVYILGAMNVKAQQDLAKNPGPGLNAVQLVPVVGESDGFGVHGATAPSGRTSADGAGPGAGTTDEAPKMLIPEPSKFEPPKGCTQKFIAVGVEGQYAGWVFVLHADGENWTTGAKLTDATFRMLKRRIDGEFESPAPKEQSHA